jgi:hypothetical protein
VPPYNLTLPFVFFSEISTFASLARLQVKPALSFAAALYWARETLVAGHAPAVAAARVMNAQLRAVAALQTCASCVAAGEARELIDIRIHMHTYSP